MRKKDYLENMTRGGGDKLTRIFKKKIVTRAWTGLIWLRKVTNGGLL